MSFMTDIATLRERARAKMSEGPITDAYGADRTHNRAFDNEQQHHAGARRAKRAKHGDVSTSFDDDEDQHRRDVERGDCDD